MHASIKEERIGGTDVVYILRNLLDSQHNTKGVEVCQKHSHICFTMTIKEILDCQFEMTIVQLSNTV